MTRPGPSLIITSVCRHMNQPEGRGEGNPHADGLLSIQQATC
ncbi:hypothetical protein APY03_6719 [Variovorax sp. WDL1]|nr:hypothetical protein APY03_6719 [Variovorax sp. WDL1]